MLKEIIIGIAVAIGALCVLATLVFLVMSLLPSPTTRRLLKRWQSRGASAPAYRSAIQEKRKPV